MFKLDQKFQSSNIFRDRTYEGHIWRHRLDCFEVPRLHDFFTIRSILSELRELYSSLQNLRQHTQEFEKFLRSWLIGKDWSFVGPIIPIQSDTYLKSRPSCSLLVYLALIDDSYWNTVLG